LAIKVILTPLYVTPVIAPASPSQFAMTNNTRSEPVQVCEYVKDVVELA
jgi:hypothetical protein